MSSFPLRSGVKTPGRAGTRAPANSIPTLTGIDRSRLQDEYLPYPVQISPAVPIPTATSPDGRRRARGLPGRFSASRREQRVKDAACTVEVQDVPTGRVLHTLVGHTADVICIAFSPDGRRIATASFDRTVKLWDTATGREVFTLRGHTAGVIALAFSPDGSRIVSGGLDRTARVWDATPLPAGILHAQESRHRQKQTRAEGAPGQIPRRKRTPEWETSLPRSGSGT